LRSLGPVPASSFARLTAWCLLGFVLLSDHCVVVRSRFDLILYGWLINSTLLCLHPCKVAPPRGRCSRPAAAHQRHLLHREPHRRAEGMLSSLLFCPEFVLLWTSVSVRLLRSFGCVAALSLLDVWIDASLAVAMLFLLAVVHAAVSHAECRCVHGEQALHLPRGEQRVWHRRADRYVLSFCAVSVGLLRRVVPLSLPAASVFACLLR
jgi:hypothetical protein